MHDDRTPIQICLATIRTMAEAAVLIGLVWAVAALAVGLSPEKLPV